MSTNTKQQQQQQQKQQPKQSSKPRVSKLASPVDKEGREVQPVSPALLLAALTILPVWAVTVVPFAVVYQASRKILKPVLPKHKSQPLDSGYKVDDSMIKPRQERKYDIVVLGATGFTGKLAVRHLAKVYGVDGSKVKWAVAGRSQDKLDKAKKEIGEELGVDLSNIDCIIVDTSVASTMPKLVQDTRCVATTAGPYALYGSAVVEFCAKFGTHYVDITGEVDWVKAMMLQWQDTAKKTGARLISFCGHDSIPWDISTFKMMQVMKEKLGDDLQSVCFWDEAKGGAPGGTLATAFSIIEGKSIKPPKTDFNPFLKLADGSRSQYDTKTQFPLITKKAQSPWTTKNKRRWVVPFVMAPVNGAVVRWSHALQQKGSRQLFYSETQVFNDFVSAAVTYIGLVIVSGLLFNPITAYILKNYILPKPGSGPSIKEMDSNFACVYGEGIGAKGSRVESIMYFDKDLGCLETSRLLIESGLSLALSEDELPAKDGGFYPPAIGMGDVLLDRMTQTGTSFQCVPVTED
jgi:short subunit dehydrogenase-like uncharacterized protein